MPGYYDNQIAAAESNYQASLSKLNNIRQSNYVYYTTEYRTEKSRYIPGWKCTHYKTRQVPYQVQHVNYAQYHHDKAEAGKDLANKESAIRSTYNSAISAKNSETSALQASLTNILRETELAKQEYQRAIRLKEAAEARVADSKLRVSNLEEILQAENEEIARIESIYKESADRYLIVFNRHNYLSSEISSKIRSISAQERAELFFQFYDKANTDSLKEEILAEGIDLNYIAYKSIISGREDLLDYAIDKGVDLDKEVVDDTSILIHAVKHRSPFVNKILEHTENYDNSLLKLITSGDKRALEILLEHKQELINSKIWGLNLLHIAILSNNIESVEYLLENHIELLEERTSNNISSFYIALSKGSDALISKIGEYLSIKEEINNLLGSFRIEDKEVLLEKLLVLYPEKVDVSLVYHICAESSDANLKQRLMEHYTGDIEELQEGFSYLSNIESGEDMLDSMEFYVDYNDM